MRIKTLLAALLLALALPVAAFAQRATCQIDPQAVLPRACNGLQSFHKFEEGADSRRYDSYGFFALEEGDAASPGRDTVNKKFGAASYNGAGAGLRVKHAGTPGPGFWTVAIWVRPTAIPATAHYFLSTTSSSPNENTWGCRMLEEPRDHSSH